MLILLLASLTSGCGWIHYHDHHDNGLHRGHHKDHDHHGKGHDRDDDDRDDDRDRHDYDKHKGGKGKKK